MGGLAGPFLGLSEQRLNTPQQILSPDDTAELRNLIDYGNRFHHDHKSGLASRKHQLG
jgi:hypothetical protein